MRELKIFFEFLCAVVPPQPFSQAPPPNSCWMVLPDFRKAKTPHEPVVLYDRDDRNSDAEVIKAGHAVKEKGTSSPKPLDTWDALYLRSEQLEIRPDDKALGTAKLKTSAALDAALRIYHAEVVMEVFHSDLLFDTSSAVADKVAGRLALGEGNLQPGLITPEKFGVYDFKKVPVLRYSQPMAQQVVYTVGFVDFVDIVFTKLTTGAAPRLRLRPNTSQDISVTVRNVEQTVMWNRSLPKYDDMLHEEINLFFALSRAYNPASPPNEILLKLTQDGPLGICAPKTFDGWT